MIRPVTGHLQAIKIHTIHNSIASLFLYGKIENTVVGYYILYVHIKRQNVTIYVNAKFQNQLNAC